MRKDCLFPTEKYMYSSSQRKRNGKIGVGQVAVSGAGTFTAEDTERLVILKAARNNWNICRIERHLWRSFFVRIIMKIICTWKISTMLYLTMVF